MKIMKQFRLSKEIVDILEQLSNQTGKTQTQIVEDAIKNLHSNENKIKSEVELYKKENEQLKMVIKVFQEREKAIEKVEDSYERLIKDKEERIKELKERIEELKTYQDYKKPFWKFW